MHERISGGAGSGKTAELADRARKFSGKALVLAPTSFLCGRLGALTSLPAATPAGLAEQIIRAVRPETSEVTSNEKKSRFSSEKEYRERLSLGAPISLCGEVMKSFGEIDIANFLFGARIDYIYEAPYKHDTRTDERSQYRPDFYLPEYDIYIEYFAVDKDGNVPDYFGDGDEYLRSMEWKFALHERYGTTLVPLCSYERADGTLIKKLTAYLKKHKIKIRKRRKSELYPKSPERMTDAPDALEARLEAACTYVKEGRYVCPYDRIFVDGIEYISDAARGLIGALGVDVTYTETDGADVRCPEKHFIFSFTEKGMMREIVSVLDKLEHERVFIIGRGKRDADILLHERAIKSHYDREDECVRARYLKRVGLDIRYFGASATPGRECDVAFILASGFDEGDKELFALAATRAVRSVYIVSKTGDESPLAAEMRRAAGVSGKKSFTCPKCGAPLSVVHGKYGDFLGCRKCKYKRKM